ncbi:ATP synthase F0, B subunit [Xylanimonas cellulosilytica DSM 15894]|uniref:ATP synthase subunit b n=1 Tax=Xylanimonas cellulosilytica (strain DSM 15894 / JCM 12276 / CECT 5975 / KCTC 9989 / LMG 20990 / NBRC 107835 / XIL07) TaxID=446471 RepID=D1BWC2_XYLCX|nr:F0F1 ATP synthase subunit B [Xylanimonas cellulosilytica]ACZ31467.1 ATP synthase F0, B subunit [Xylanimonas cellulosilytica DSM 15894]
MITESIPVLLAQTEPQGRDLFLPADYDLLWSAVVLVIIAVAFYKFVLPPMLKVLDERTEAIEGGMAQAAQAKEAAEQALERQQELLTAARSDAAKVRDEAREEGKAIVAEHRSKAQEEAARITETAHRQIEAERQAAAVSLRTDVGDLATQLASKIVGEELADSAARARVVDRFLDELETTQTASAASSSGTVG